MLISALVKEASICSGWECGVSQLAKELRISDYWMPSLKWDITLSTTQETSWKKGQIKYKRITEMSHGSEHWLTSLTTWVPCWRPRGRRKELTPGRCFLLYTYSAVLHVFLCVHEHTWTCMHVYTHKIHGSRRGREDNEKIKSKYIMY